jgi:hypothetical protein
LKGHKTTVLVGILLFCLFLFSCGKKEDPFLPVEETNARVTGLQGEWKGDYVLLTGQVQDPAGTAGSIEGCRVYYAIYPWDQPPCEGCPIEYKGFQLFGKEVLTPTGFACKVPGIERENIYYFEVRAVGPNGSLGPPSNRVRVEVPELRK